MAIIYNFAIFVNNAKFLSELLADILRYNLNYYIDSQLVDFI